MKPMQWSRRTKAIIAVVVVAVTVMMVRHVRAPDTYTAYFETATGLYEGNEVKVLGVKVGRVTAVTQQTTRVKVDFEVDSDQPIPRGVKVALIAPSLVTGRFIQLAPVFTGGPELKPGSTIPETRTAVPVEFDDVKKQLTTLADALGPRDGGEGALNDVISVAAKNLDATTAKNLRSSIRGMSDAVDTITASSDDIFSTVRGVDSFLSNLVDNDAGLRAFSTQLDSTSAFLAEDRAMISESIRVLQVALKDLTTFVKENRGAVSTSIDKLTTLSETLAQEKIQLANAVHQAPTVMVNYYNIQDPYHGGVIGRPVLNYFNNVAQFTCGLVLGVGGTNATCSQALQSMLQALSLPVALPGAPGNPVLTEDGANPLAPLLTGEGGLSELIGGLATSANGDQTTPGLLGSLLGGGQ